MMWLIIGGIVLAGGFMVFTGAPYVPSKKRDLKRAFTELYPLTTRDTLVDIGSGDGVVLRVARQYGAGEAVGYEIHPVLVLISKLYSRRDRHVHVYLADYRFSSFPQSTTVVYTFGDSHHITRMYQHVQREATRLDRTLQFITYGFEVSTVKPDRTVGAHHIYAITPLRHTSEPV